MAPPHVPAIYGVSQGLIHSHSDQNNIPMVSHILWEKIFCESHWRTSSTTSLLRSMSFAVQTVSSPRWRTLQEATCGSLTPLQICASATVGTRQSFVTVCLAANARKPPSYLQTSPRSPSWRFFVMNLTLMSHRAGQKVNGQLQQKLSIL